MDKSYRSPICSILGHVDAGKTLFLDRLRSTSVQAGEPGGITQKIGVTYLSRPTLQNLVGVTKNGSTFEVPGIMFVDTPGHSCFTAQRMVGVEISDLVIIVLDIFKGLEQQTIESINLLRKSNTPCIIIANKIDRILNWKSHDCRNIREAYRNQEEHTQQHYNEYINRIIGQCAEQSLNASLYYKNNNYREYISIIPFSARTGEGMPDLLMMISILCTKYLHKKISISNQVVTGFMIERMVTQTFGTIITSVLTDGHISQGDRLIFRDIYGNIIDSKVNRIYVPNEKSEVKDRFAFKSVESMEEPQSIVLNLEYSGEILTGTRFYAYSNLEEKESHIKTLVDESIRESERVDYEYSKKGVYLVAPSIGMLDGLYNICDSRNIKISGCKLGYISKTDIIKANPNLDYRTDDEAIYNERYAVILAYGIEVNKETDHEARINNVVILSDDIIYHLLDSYEEFSKKLDLKIRSKNPNLQLPFRAQILSQYIFRKDKPILIGAKIIEGNLHSGQNVMAVKDNKNIIIGTIIGIQNNKSDIQIASLDDEVCLKIDNSHTLVKYGRDFDESFDIIPSYTRDEEYLVTKYSEIFKN